METDLGALYTVLFGGFFWEFVFFSLFFVFLSFLTLKTSKTGNKNI